MLIQFLLVARIGKASAINDRTVVFGSGTIDLSESIVWIKGIPIPLIREMLLKALIQIWLWRLFWHTHFPAFMDSYSRKEAGLDTAQAWQTKAKARLDVNKKVARVILRAEKLFAKSVTKLKCSEFLVSIINNLRLSDIKKGSPCLAPFFSASCL